MRQLHHLTESQRASIAAELANLDHGERQDQTRKFATLTPLWPSKTGAADLPVLYLSQ